MRLWQGNNVIRGGPRPTKLYNTNGFHKWIFDCFCLLETHTIRIKMSERTIYVAQKGKVVPWTIPKRDLKEGQVRVDVHSVGINPVDWKTIDNELADGAGQGNDFAGTIVEIGPNVTGAKVGDTVAGGIGGGDVDNTENGVFTELLNVDENLLFKFPQKLESASSSSVDLSKPSVPSTFEQAASLGIAIDTTALAYDEHKPKGGEWALVYGLTSSVGFIAAQYARNLGYKVIAVSGELKGVSDALSGVHWFDRKDPEWVSKAENLLAGAKVKHTLDTISTPEEIPALFKLTDPKGTVQFLDPGFQIPEETKKEFPGVTVEYPLYFFLVQEHKKFGPNLIPDPKQTHKRAPQIIGEINEQFSKGEIKTLPITVLHGFDQISEGLAKNRNGVRGAKVVINRE